jgi:hypothetical protein
MASRGEGENSDLSSATSVGLYGAFEGLVLSSAVTGAAHHFHKGFRVNVGPSGKMAGIMMFTTFRFVYDMQSEIARQNKANFRKQAIASANRRNTNA